MDFGVGFRGGDGEVRVEGLDGRRNGRMMVGVKFANLLVERGKEFDSTNSTYQIV